MSTLIKMFEFSDENRRRITITHTGASRLALDPDLDVLMLTEGQGSDAYATTWITRPGALVQLLGLFADVKHARVDGQPVTSVWLQLLDANGVAYHWDGSSWSADGTQWSPELDVANHIQDFAQAGQQRGFGVRVQLRTAVAGLTPQLRAVRVAYSANLKSHMEDVIYRSLVPDLRARVLFDLTVMGEGDGTANLSVAATLAAAGLDVDVAGVDAVYDIDVDPRNNLLAAHAGDVVTLTAPASAGARLKLEMAARADVVVGQTHPDFIEVGRLPAVVLSDIVVSETARVMAQEYVANKGTAAAIVLPAPELGQVDIPVRLIAGGAVDLQRLMEAVETRLADDPALVSAGTDERYSMLLAQRFQLDAPVGVPGQHSARGMIRIYNVARYVRPARGGYVVKHLKLTGDMGGTLVDAAEYDPAGA